MRTTNGEDAGLQLQQEHPQIPPSVAKPVERHRQNIGGKMYDDEIVILNMRLKQYGYKNAADLLKDFRDGIFPEQMFKPQGALDMSQNQSSNGSVSLVNGKANPEFFNHLDYAKMYEFFRNELKLSEWYSRSCCNYVKYNWRVFFGDHPEELYKLTSDQKQWIVLSFRNFAKYYLRITGSTEIEEAVRLTIKRYSLNIGLGFEKRLIIVDENYIQKTCKEVMSMNGDIGLIAQAGLFAGTREDELVYIHDTPICTNGICYVDKCKKLHTIRKKNGMVMVIVNWHRRNKHCYFTIMPNLIWEMFRSLQKFTYNDIKSVHLYLRSNMNLKFMYLRKLHYNVMVRTMEKDAAEALAGRANTVSARHYMIVEADQMSDRTVDAWGRFGVNTPR